MFHELNEYKDEKISLIVKLLFILFLILVYFFCIYKVEIFDNYLGMVLERNGDYYVKIYLEDNYSKFIFNNQILIDDNKYNYEIIDVDSSSGNSIVEIKIDINKEYLITNTYINIKQKNVSNSLFDIILQKLKKGMNL